MAYLYRRPKSPFWWIGYKTLDGTRREATPFRTELQADTRRAKQLRAERELTEMKLVATQPAHHWSAWVTPFLKSRYSHSPRTRDRMLGTWKTLAVFLAELELPTPAHVRREHCLRYVDWRKEAGHMNAQLRKGRAVAHNTVLLELRCFNVVLTEAVHRGMIEASPCWRLGLKREPAKEARELTAESEQIIRDELARLLRASRHDRGGDAWLKADFLRVSWKIAMAQGIRVNETWLPLTAFNFDELLIYRTVKGRRNEETELNPALVPFLRRLQRAGRTHTFARPANPPLVWFKFFEHLRLRHPELKLVSHRSCRVTFISRLERAGIQRDVVAKMVAHSSTITTRVYRRVKRLEVAKVWAALDRPVDAAETPPAPQSPG